LAGGVFGDSRDDPAVASSFARPQVDLRRPASAGTAANGDGVQKSFFGKRTAAKVAGQ
jgi:hypothetical protein